ncbi:MAG TPA: D-alanyl-D-alanine carboxypeptidase [Desulfitobacterium dehalogenans]|uniref:D-alanyl-D-alanine carboxypeptidase n=1 Tax=Desulfitobacterium dehalogenans TaxID=36854 RepID=A0A7C6Z407_9FIRM|nr:D-alanyl-D-alanine carboxypeptidase [Desulfitobacterium dehalogenans]
MRLITVLFTALAMLLNFAAPVFGSPDKAPVPEVSSEGAILIDITTGQTLFAKNSDHPFEPASTTKIMSALIALEKGNLNDMVTAGPSVLNQELAQGTRIYLEPGEQVTLGNLLYALLLNSANDAAVAIAEHIGGDIQGFTDLMNAKAKEIGALNTSFKNPSGLSADGHLTTARDLAMIARFAYQNPVFRDYVKTKTKIIPRNRENIPAEMYNINEFIWTDPTVTGMKTGYTSSAGNTYVATAERDGRALLGVVLKSPSKTSIYTDMRKLFEYGFTNFENVVYKPKGTALSSLVVGDTPVNLILTDEIIHTREIGSTAPPDISFHVLPIASELKEIMKDQVLTSVQMVEGDMILNSFALMADSSVIPPQPSSKKSLNWGAPIILILFFLLYMVYRRVSYLRRHRRIERKMTAGKYRDRDLF